MIDLAKLDPRFAVAEPDENGLVRRDARHECFGLYGVTCREHRYVRMPVEIARNVSSGVEDLCTHTAGGRLRFRTDSPVVGIHAVMSPIHRMPHFALSGTAGFDIYDHGVYAGTFMPPYDIRDGYTSVIQLPSAEEHDVLIHLPLYSGVTELQIALKDGSWVKTADAYAGAAPVVAYGSSITQGGCASRPGNTYLSILSRELNVDHVNLGFSGNAKGEQAMADYIAGLRMSAFILDYDHNAPDAEHLMRTHEPFFRTVRKAQPELPIIMMPRPKAVLTDAEKQRRDIVRKTYKHARAEGDRHVYYLEIGEALQLFCGNDGTVDNCHLTDLGFYAAASALKPILKEILRL